MLVSGQRKQIALGANILFDLADQDGFAQDFCGFFRDAGYAMVISPTILFELVFAGSHDPEPQRHLARKAVTTALEWGIRPFQLAQAVRQRGLLPAIELNDSLILAETALARISLLMTGDYHLVDIDLDALALTFAEIGLPPVHPIHPNRLLRLIQ